MYSCGVSQPLPAERARANSTRRPVTFKRAYANVPARARFVRAGVRARVCVRA
jgi:hypothetical protein